MKNLFEYDNYRSFLKDKYEAMKAKDEKYSYRWFSKEMGVKAPNFLKRIIDGERNLSPDSIEKLAKALKLTNQESFFFHNLVLFNQAENPDEKKIHAEQLVKTRGFKKFHPLGEERFNFYAKWYYIPILEMVSAKNFKEDEAWIAGCLRPKILPGEARTALDALLKLGLIRRGADGKLSASDANIETGDEVTSSSVAQYHRDMIRMGADSIDRFAKESRDISALTFRLSKEKVQKVKEIVQRFRRELGDVVADEKDVHRIYQMNFQFFPIAVLTDEEDHSS